MPIDIQRILELAPLVVAAMKPGSPEAAAMMQGFLHSKEQMRQRTLQEQNAQSEQAMRQAQIANLAADNQRANEALDLQRQNVGINRAKAFGEMSQSVVQPLQKSPETMLPPGTDLLGTQNAIVADRLTQQQMLGIPAGTPQGPLPNLTALASEGKKRRAKALYEEAKKTFGDEAMAGDSITIQSPEFGPIKPSALQAMYSTPATVAVANGNGGGAVGEPAKPFVKTTAPALGTPGDFISKWARERGKSPDALTSSETAAALKEYRDSTQKTPVNATGVSEEPKIPPGSLKIEDVPEADRAYVQGMLEYRLPMPTSYALARSPLWQRRIDLATAVDPTFDANQYPARQKARAAFTSGKEAQNIRGLNTAVGHINSLVSAADAMKNGDWADANAALNFMAQHAPVTAALKERQGTTTNIRGKFNAVTGELASIFKQSGATDQEIAAWKNTVGGDPAAATPTQWKAFVNGALELMGSRMTTLASQYEVAMGKPKDFRLLSPESRAILSKLGQNVDAMDPIGTVGGTEPPPQSGGRIRVKGPNGETGTVPIGTALPPGWTKQ